MKTNKDYALDYLKMSLSVIPVKGKDPLIKWGKYQTERPTEADINNWWNRWPNANIGIVTGKLSGIVVVDVDGGIVPDFRDTPTSQTSPGKFHFYFAHPGFDIPDSAKKVAPNIDIRGDGGFVVAPPSQHFNKETGEPDCKYEWQNPLGEIQLAPLPEWVLDKINSEGKKPIKEIVKGIALGSRNVDATSLIGSLLSRYPQRDWEEICWPLVESWNQKNEPPLSPKELREVFDSISIRQLRKQTNDISWPAPLASRAFYGVAGEFVRTIEPHSEADPAALLLNFLIAFGSIVGDKPHIKIGATKHPVRLFGVLVGKTAKGRKGESWGYPKEVFVRIDDVWGHKIESGLSSGEGLIWAVRDEITKKEPIKNKKTGEITGYQDVIMDEGIKDKRLLVLQSELASTLRVLGRDGNTLSATIRDAWDTGDLQTLTKNSPARATRAHISIIGHITKDELLKYLTNTETANGFGNRFLWLCVGRSKCLPFGGNLPEVDLELLVAKIKSAVEFAKGVDEISWASDTRPLWERIYPILSEGKPGLVGMMTSRAEAIVIRIACIYALLDKYTLIEPQHLLAALAVWDYAERSVNYIFSDKIGDPLAERVLDALIAKPLGMNRTELSNYFGNNLSSDQISTSLKILEALGRAKKEIVSTNGRKRESWHATAKRDNSFISLNSYLEILEKYVEGNELTIPSSPTKDYEKNEINEIFEQGTIIMEEGPEKCRTCGGTDFWIRPEDGGNVCRRCHPPTSGKGEMS